MNGNDAWVALGPCGHSVAVVSGQDEYRKSAARVVAGWIRKGLRIERWSDDRVRREFGGCTEACTVKS